RASTRPVSSKPRRRRSRTALSRKRSRPCRISRFTRRSLRSRRRDRLLGIAAVQQPLGDALAPVVAADLRDRRADVVGGAAELELTAIEPDRPRGSRVAVERHPDAAGVDQLRFVRARTPKLQMAVSEEDLPLLDPGEQ